MHNSLEPGALILQIISSIRAIDGRISEIRNNIVNKYFTEPGTELAKDRMKKLLETRMQLYYSLFDSTQAFSKYLGQETQITYENLKREIEQQ